MFRLTREVRFAVNLSPERRGQRQAINGYGGYPPLNGFGTFLALHVTLVGELDPASNYLLNIRDVDAVVREQAIGVIEAAVAGERRQTPEQVVLALFAILQRVWVWPAPVEALAPPSEVAAVRLTAPAPRLDALTLCLSPFVSCSAHAAEVPMVRLSEKFEFSATHRLHNPKLSEDENRRHFGKCNNPHGHGHNYELQVTLRGTPDANGVLIDVPALETIVAKTVIDRFDHRNLNIELPEFAELIPTVENIARVVHGLLKPALGAAGATLDSVTVWETPKTWCEYRE